MYLIRVEKEGKKESRIARSYQDSFDENADVQIIETGGKRIAEKKSGEKNLTYK